ncbi:MAG: xanthine dehydrogenase family protein subunit M, partial [Pseudomonadota bacterium]
EEVARRSGDFALAAVGVALEIRDEVVSNVRIAVTGVGEIPLRLQGVEQSLIKGQLQELDDLALARIGREISEAVKPSSDLQASADYRQHLLGVLGSRAIKAAWDRAKEAAR